MKREYLKYVYEFIKLKLIKLRMGGQSEFGWWWEEIVTYLIKEIYLNNPSGSPYG